MYGRVSKSTPFQQVHSFGIESYQHHLQKKLAEMHGFVETNTVEAAHRQRRNYNKHSQTRKFVVEDSVWLSVPTARKLDPQWDGR